MKSGNLILLIFIVFNISCISKYKDLTLNTKTRLVVPIAYGEYTLGDLFYNVNEPDNLVLNRGVFHQITDTIPFNNSSLFEKIKDADLIFRANNIMPFQVDMVLIPFDTLSNSFIGDELFITIVEAAAYNESSLSLISIVSEQILLLEADQIELLKKSNALLIDAKFIWPYEKVETSIIDDFYELNAFNIKMILNANLNIQ